MLCISGAVTRNQLMSFHILLFLHLLPLFDPQAVSMEVEPPVQKEGRHRLDGRRSRSGSRWVERFRSRLCVTRSIDNAPVLVRTPAWCRSSRSPRRRRSRSNSRSRRPRYRRSRSRSRDRRRTSPRSQSQERNERERERERRQRGLPRTKSGTLSGV